jgi:thiol-disulfide isomerase/thioredoxin
MARQAFANAAQFAHGRRGLPALPMGGWLRLAVIACAALAVALALLAHALTPPANQSQALIGHAAPPFTLTAAQHGQTLAQPITFDGRSGRPTLLVFFNTLCVHCVAGVQTAHVVAQAPSQSAIRVIYLDAPGENAEITGQYMARLRYDAPVLLDHGAGVASRYGVAYYPTIILVDTQGVVRATWTGSPSASEVRAAIARSQ